MISKQVTQTSLAAFHAEWRKDIYLSNNGLSKELGHPHPVSNDPTGEAFTFGKHVGKMGGGKGFADVWKRRFFAWEYKGKGKDQQAAYLQLQRYRDALENPPLLVVCDIERIVIHTNFTNTPHVVHTILLEDLDKPEHLTKLRAAFFDPAQLRPGVTREGYTLVTNGRSLTSIEYCQSAFPW